VLAAVLVSVLAVAVLITFAGRAACHELGFFGLSGITPMLFRQRKEPEEVVLDERDTAVGQKAVIAGGMASCLAFVVACMTARFVCMARGQKDMSKDISIHYLPFVVVSGAITPMGVKSVVTLAFHGSGARDDEH